MKIGITADCSSCLEYAQFEHNVRITRTAIHFENETLIDGIDITSDEFYKRLEASDYIPTTSAPTWSEIEKHVETYKKLGYTDVIHFPISFNLSSYGLNWQNLAKEMFEGINFHVFDTRTACIMEGYQAYYAEILAAKNYDVKGIFAEVAKLRDATKAFFVVDDLRYLVKSGRLTTVAGLIGTLAKIKPILEIDTEGRIVPFEKIRTHRRAIDRMIDLSLESCKHAKNVIYIVQHANRCEGAEEIAKIIKAKAHNASRVEISVITPTVGAHIGSGLLGIARIITDDLKEKI